MNRTVPILVVLLGTGCATSPSRPQGPLDRLIEKSNAYSSFHLHAEITDGKTAVPVEMAFRAPDRALLKYGTVATTLLRGGISHHFLRGTYYSFPFGERVEELRGRYSGLKTGAAPEPVFSLGDGLRAMLSPGRLGARLGWLEELRSYQAEAGNLYRRGPTEFELREDGFISRTMTGGHGFTLKSVQINTPLPDSLFEVPPTQGMQDATDRLRSDLEKGLDEVFHRWILETSTADETIESMIRVDLARLYQPEKMTELLRQGLAKKLEAFDALHPNSRPEVLKDKLLIERGRAMGDVETMEDEIQKHFEHALDLYLRGMDPIPTQKEMLDLVRRWQAAVKRQVDVQIRLRFGAVYDEASKQ